MIGILSFAHYHANFWAEELLAQGALEGIWDDDAERGREAAERFGTEFHSDLDSFLRQCTAVAICCETVRHAELVERAAALGLHILVEKPIATCSRDADRIRDAVREHGVRFMQSFPKRLDPASIYLKQVVDSGEIGPIHLVRIRHGHHYGLTPDFPQRWYVRPELAGGGALLDEGLHGADLLAWLFGMPQSVSALTSHAALGLAVEDLGVATYRFADGMVAELTASFCFMAADTSIEFYSRRGTVLVSAVDLASRDVTDAGFVRICRRATPEVAPRWEVVPITPRFKAGQFHQQSARAFFEGLRDATPFPASVEDGARALLMIERAYESARSGRCISFHGKPDE